MTAWERKTVSELHDEEALYVIDGNHGADRPRPDEFEDEGTPFIRAADLGDGRIRFDEADRINATALDRIRKGFAQAGDVLLSHKGTVGRVAVAGADAPDFVCSPQTTLWRTLNEDRLDPGYLAAYLESPFFRRQLDACMHESDMAPYVSLTNQRALTVLLPPIETQRQVGGVFNALHGRIDNCRRLVESTDDLGAALFRKRFLNFEGESLVESEIGKIPEAWRPGSIADLADYVNGRNFTKDATGVGRMVIRIAELNSGPGRSTVYNEVEVDDRHLARHGDILFSWSGTLGVYLWIRDEAVINQHIFKVLPRGFSDWFVFLHLRAALPAFQAIAADKATTMGHIKRGHLAVHVIAIPPDDVLCSAAAVFEPLFELRRLKLTESLRLSELRRALLPQLFADSGATNGSNPDETSLGDRDFLDDEPA